MLRSISVCAALFSAVALAAVAPTPQVQGAEQSAFDGANRTLFEQSMSRACDQFGDFLKRFPRSELAAEAKVKRARACLLQSRETKTSLDDLRAIAASNEVSYPKALANLTLSEHGDNYAPKLPRGRREAAVDDFEAVGRSSDGRWAKEARAQFFRLLLTQLEQNAYYRKQAEAICDRILRLEPDAETRAHAMLSRAYAWLQSGEAAYAGRAETDLLDLGRGKTEFADDALFMLGQLYGQRAEYEKALQRYDEVVSRFSGVTSNVRDQAASAAAEIRRPVLSAGVSYLELPGEVPELNLNVRNQGEVRLTLRRVNPMGSTAHALLGKQGECTAEGETVQTLRTWTVQTKAPKPYAPVSLTVKLEVPGAGSYVVDAKTDALSTCASALVTPNAAMLKVSRTGALLFVADAMTGVAVKNAKVVIAADEYNRAQDHRYDAVTDEEGIARVAFEGGRPVGQVTAWAESGTALTFARGYFNGYYATAQEYLAYVVTDRPLYKPGEKVGAKVFLRSRSEGPSVPGANRPLHLRIYDGQSRELKAFDLTTNGFGTATFELPLGKDAALGQYTVYVESQGWSLQQRHNTFRVEEYKPPEFSVKVEPVGSPTPGEPVKVKISASRYSGGPVANAQGRAIVLERGYVHSWKKWADDLDVEAWGYEDENEYRYSRGNYWQPTYRQQTVTFKTGADGTCEVELPKPTDAGDRSYQLQIFVTDQSRREVNGAGTVNVSRTPYFVDVRSDRVLYKPGEAVKVKLRAEDSNGRAQSPKVEVRLARVNADGTTSAILARQVQLQNGFADASLDGDAVGAVRVEVRAVDTEPLLASTDVWLTNDTKPIIPPTNGFMLYTDRAPLKVGGTVRALLVTPTAGGHALVTVEGEGVHFSKAVALTGRARFVELPLTTAMTPNAWLTLTRFEQGQLYARQAVIKVNGGDAVLNVDVVHTAFQVEPGASQRATVNVKGFDGPVEVAVSSVDEATFAIEEQSLDFASWLGRRPQRLGVTSAATQNQKGFRPPKQRKQPDPDAQNEQEKPRDLAGAGNALDKGMPAPVAEAQFDDAVEQRAEKKEMAPAREAAKSKAQAGPVAGEDAPVKVRTNFSSSAGWFPQLSGRGNVSTALQVPDSLSRFRTVAWVVSQGPQLGVGASSFRTEKPLMVRLEAPRFFTERDEVTLSALVSSRLSQAASVKVEFEAPGLKPLDRTVRTVDVPAGGDVRVDARFVVVEPGLRKVKVVARGGGRADAVELELPAVVHGSAQRVAFSGRLSNANELTVKLPELRNASGTKFQLTVSPTLVSVMVDGLPYLAEYPYGCVEQTLSRFVPAVIAGRTVSKLGLPSSRMPAELPQMIDAGLKRLYGFQHGDGGWGWWQSDSTNRWMTAYVVYGLSLAKDAGVAVDAQVIARGREYLVNHLGAALSYPEEHAFMVFALSSTGTVPRAALDKAFDRRSKLSGRGRGMLANALLNAHDSRARIGIENLDDIIVAAKARADSSVGGANDAWSTSEAIEATAFTLMALSRYESQSPNIKPLTDFLVLRRNGGKWRTTRDTAFAIYALSELALKDRSSAASGTVIVEVNGKEAGRVKYSNGGLTMSAPIVLGDSAFRPGENRIVLKKDGGAAVGYFGAMFDVYNRDENVKGVGSDVKVTRRYTLLGRPSSEKASAPTEYGMPVESGVRVRVDVEVKANKAMQYLMVEDLKPAGFEAVEQKSGQQLCGYRCAHAELRTDRVAFFFTDISVGTTTVSYELRAEVPGKFHALPARVEAMYAPELQATTDEMRFEVRDAPEPSEQGVAKDER